MTRPLVITGTNTNVGKTLLARLLLERAAERGIRIAAMKPFCSGGREDAETLHRFQNADLTLDEVNPFFFEPPVTPLVAARAKGRRITLDEALAAIARVQDRGFPLVIEGAGGLLSPLGEGFSLLDIVQALHAKTIIVAQNQLGALSQTLLTARALDQTTAIVLMSPEQADPSTSTNREILAELLPKTPILTLPRLAPSMPRDAGVNSVLDQLIETALEG